MDSKRWYKRISTCFWFFLATLPFWLSTLAYVLSFFIHFDGVTSMTDISNFYGTKTWSYFMDLNVSALSSWTPTWLKLAFRDLFTNFSTSTVSGWLVNCLAWFVWVYLLELIVDFLVWLPKMCHDWMTKFGG